MVVARSPDKSASWERVKEAFDYDPATGILRWRISPHPRIKVGQIAGSLEASGYWRVCLDGVIYKAQRLIFFWMTGRWPIPTADHRDLDKLNNRWVNIREASNQGQTANRGLTSSNTSGSRGVVWDKKTSKWQAQIWHTGKLHYLGQFIVKSDAEQAYAREASRIFGGFYRP